MKGREVTYDTRSGLATLHRGWVERKKRREKEMREETKSRRQKISL